jgi:hypothetical protein
MNRELKIYNRFDELILHLKFIPNDSLPLQIEDGTPELREAVRSLSGKDFDQTVVVEKERRRFFAEWGTPEYLDALAGYWSTNFGWQSSIVEAAPISKFSDAQYDSCFPTLLAGQYVAYGNAHRVFPSFGEIDLQNSQVARLSTVNFLGASLDVTNLPANLFTVRSEPRFVFSFQPDPTLLKTENYSVGFGADQYLAQATVRVNNPKVQPIVNAPNAMAA